nr:hypothetical protein [Bradyrhizobium lablabi]
MKNSRKLLLTVAAATTAVVVSSEPLSARGGAANIMDSPGYQRRLQESRQQLAQPSVHPSSTHRHRGRHK